MVSGTDYAKLYNEAYVAYGQGNYEEAATLMEPMAEVFPKILMFSCYKVTSISAWEDMKVLVNNINPYYNARIVRI